MNFHCSECCKVLRIDRLNAAQKAELHFVANYAREYPVFEKWQAMNDRILAIQYQFS